MQRKRANIFLFLIFLSCLLAFDSASAYADNSKKIRQEIVKNNKRLKSIEKGLELKKHKLDIINKKETSTLTILDKIEKELAKKEDELARLEKNIRNLRIKINATDKDMEELAMEREKLFIMLKKRVVSMYKMREGGVVRLLFSSDSINNFSHNYKYINEIIDADIELLDRYDKNKRDLEDKKERLDTMKSLTLSLKKQTDLKKKDIAAEKKKKQIVLASIREEKGLHLSALAELERAKTGLQALIDGLKEQEKKAAEKEKTLSRNRGNIDRDTEPMPSTGFGAMRGKLPMPIDGKIVSLYGKVEDPKFHTATFNNGIKIEAPDGTNVKAVYKGKVIYSGWLKGYGRIMILDHGDGFYTIYAHLSKIIKEVDNIAEKGDIIAEAGDSGSMDGTLLYFEVRYKGVPKDPIAWLAYK